ncbi:MAG TPA: hypothetical protein VFZ84_15545, partial [Burkholderiales bacterium]
KLESGIRLSHNVYIDFPDSLWGRICRWYFLKQLNGRQAVYDHTFRELVYFKDQLEGRGGSP